MNASYTGNKIFTLRKEIGLTQKELAEKIHVTDKAISKWERGLNYPDLSLLEILATVLGTTVSILLGIEDSSDEKMIESLTIVSEEEKKNLKKEFRNRAWLNIIIGTVLFIAQIFTSKIMAENQLYGIAQVLTSGMLGFTGIIIGNEIFVLRKYRRIY